jgi:hypothetical protein
VLDSRTWQEAHRQATSLRYPLSRGAAARGSNRRKEREAEDPAEERAAASPSAAAAAITQNDTSDSHASGKNPFQPLLPAVAAGSGAAEQPRSATAGAAGSAPQDSLGGGARAPAVERAATSAPAVAAPPSETQGQQGGRQAALSRSLTILPSGRPKPEARARVGSDEFSDHPSVTTSKAGMAEETWLCCVQ